MEHAAQDWEAVVVRHIEVGRGCMVKQLRKQQHRRIASRHSCAAQGLQAEPSKAIHPAMYFVIGARLQAVTALLTPVDVQRLRLVCRWWGASFAESVAGIALIQQAGSCVQRHLPRQLAPNSDGHGRGGAAAAAAAVVAQDASAGGVAAPQTMLQQRLQRARTVFPAARRVALHIQVDSVSDRERSQGQQGSGAEQEEEGAHLLRGQRELVAPGDRQELPGFFEAAAEPNPRGPGGNIEGLSIVLHEAVCRGFSPSRLVSPGRSTWVNGS